MAEIDAFKLSELKKSEKETIAANAAAATFVKKDPVTNKVTQYTPTTEEYYESLGGIDRKTGAYGYAVKAAEEQFRPYLTYEEQAVATEGLTGVARGQAINLATRKKQYDLAISRGLTPAEAAEFSGYDPVTNSIKFVNNNNNNNNQNNNNNNLNTDTSDSIKSLQAQIAQMKAEAEAAKIATKQKASDKLTALFSAYGLESLAPFINTRIMADVSEEMLLLELYDRPEYQQRFPGMASLRKKSRTITEKDYMDIEKAMTQTARFFDLPKGFYDGPEDFGNLIGAEVSAKEFQDRLQIGQDLSRTLNPSVKQQLIDFYGVGEGDLTAFVLDADKALPLIQKQAKAAQFVGIGRAAGFELRGITSGQAENIAGTESYAKLSERELAQALGQAGQLRRTQKRLSGIEGQDYSEQEALSAVIEGSPQALLASQQRAAREGARFSARGGVTGSSLRSTASPI
jgi:hypothetical protein